MSQPDCKTSTGLIRSEDISPEQIQRILKNAELFRTQRVTDHFYRQKILGLFFFEPSTRTRIGFNVAAARLGWSTIELGELRRVVGTSIQESLVDTFRSVGPYFDIIALRHSESGLVEEIARLSSVPIINAGSGNTEHPTQALADLFSIRQLKGDPQNLRIGMFGRLSHSRSALSLLKLLRNFKPRLLRLMAPERFLPDPKITRTFSTNLEISDALHLDSLDVAYCAGFPATVEQQTALAPERERFFLNKDRARALKKSAIVLCALPRIDEIDTALDNLPQMVYFQQSKLNLFVRMAILKELLNNPHEEAQSGA